ncbi:PH domain-containing protein, partial [Lentibacillus jeotgali]|uniref:PH domain-containing protein n=1 Tax=Lentibacillus jeotgali TaxID=558169 RepID=UPI0002628883
MQSLEQIENQLENISGIEKRFCKKEIHELPSILKDSEKITEFIPGNYNLKNGALVSTNERLFFIDISFTGERVFIEFDYEMISHLEYELGIIYGKLTFYHDGHFISLKEMEKKNIESMADYIRTRIPKTIPAANKAAQAGKKTLSNKMEGKETEEKGYQQNEAPPQGSETDGTKRIGKSDTEENKFHPMRPFEVKKRPEVAEKLKSWIGLKQLDADQKRFRIKEVIKVLAIFFTLAAVYFMVMLRLEVENQPIGGMLFLLLLLYLLVKGRKRFIEQLDQQDKFNAKVIYQQCMRYWNKDLIYQPPPKRGPKANVTSKFRKCGFETDTSLKIIELSQFFMIPQDYIAYIRYETKRNKQPREKMDYWGIYFRLF